MNNQKIIQIHSIVVKTTMEYTGAFKTGTIVSS